MPHSGLAPANAVSPELIGFGYTGVPTADLFGFGGGGDPELIGFGYTGVPTADLFGFGGGVEVG